MSDEEWDYIKQTGLPTLKELLSVPECDVLFWFVLLRGGKAEAEDFQDLQKVVLLK